MSERVLQLAGIRFSHTDASAVFDGLDLSLMAGERLAVIGPNGSGKTTLLHIICGLLRPSTGSVWVLGAERCREADFQAVRGRVGLLFQDADDQLFCPTVLEDVAFGPLNLGKSSTEAHGIAVATLDRLGLSDYAGRLSHQLSVGEKRLVALATVLAMEPEILLLDEPLSGLDEGTRERIKEILLGLSSAMIVISHDAGFTRDIAHRHLQVRDGVLV